MATIIKLDPKVDLGLTLSDYNLNGRAGDFDVPIWAQGLYGTKTDDEIFDDWVSAIFESFNPVIGEALVFLYTANNPYFNSTKIKENVRLAIYQEITNWRMNVPFEVKNNANFSAQAGFSFSLSIQPWLINYDAFTLKTKSFIEDTGLIGVTLEDLSTIELWIKPRFKNDINLDDVAFVELAGEDQSVLAAPSVAYMNDRIQFALTGTHKLIIGDFTITSEQDATGFVAQFNTGAEVQLDSGAIYSQALANAGDVVFLVPASGTSLRLEETVVKSDLSMIISTAANQEDLRLSAVETEISDIKSEVTDLDNKVITITAEGLTTSNTKDITGHGALPTDGLVSEPGKLARRDEIASPIAAIKTEVDAVKITADDASAKIALLDPQVTDAQTAADAATAAVQAIQPDVVTLKSDVVALKGVDASLEGRLEAIEEAESLDDKVWTGTIALVADTDISAIVDQNGNTFDFGAGDKLEVVIEKTTTALEQGHNLTINAANATPYVIGTRSVQAKLTSNGHIAITGNDLSDLNVIEVREAKAVKAISTSYSKSESDAKYELKTDAAAIKTTADEANTKASIASTVANANSAKIGIHTTAIAANKTSLGTKQDKTDASLTTTAKIIPLAINEVKTLVDSTRTTQAQIGDKPVSGGKLLDTAETIATEKFVTDAGTATTTAITTAYKAADTAILNSANAHSNSLLSTSMVVTFADGTTGTYKLGK